MDWGGQIIGQWRNDSLYIGVDSHNNTDSTIIAETNSANWEEKLHIKPIRTYFSSDGSYYSEYRNLRDSVFKRPSGTWFIKGDSIIINEVTPESTILRLHLTINGNLATFEGMIDFDGDGHVDERYFGVQKCK